MPQPVPSTATQTPWMTVTEACAYLRCGRTTLMAALYSGDLKGARNGNRWRIHRDDADAWLRAEVSA